MIRFDTNNYEYNKSSSVGIYIIHGFSNTTYEVKELAKFLGDQGFHTIANNLPGHGTTVEECNRVKYQMWIEHVVQDIANLISISEKTYVIGCSMGANLALYLSSMFPLNGCIVGGTVLKFNNPFTIHITNRLLCKIIKFSKKKIKNDSNIKYYGYSSYPLIALNEMRKLTKKVIRKLPKVKSPLLIIHTESDRLSLKENVDLVYNKTSSKIKQKFFIKHAHHNLFDDNLDQKEIFNEVLKFIAKH